MTLIEARSVSKRYGDRHALREVSMSADSGDIVAIIGPNGAGKTTLLSILAGIQKPDGGDVVAPEGGIGWVPQQSALYGKLTVAENLRLFARLERCPDVDQVVDQMLDQTDLRDRADDQVSTLSGGNRQRVNIAIGLLARPDALLLDEPSAALDPRQRERLWRFIGALADQGTTVVFSTHNVAEAERHSRRILVLADGDLLFEGAANELALDADFETAFVDFLRAKGH
ncbi:MAG TPA: ABC transporter ATP-binding protein [Thermoleophilaceae bacterium]|nr:ABC transporter ATP-binding protein [Thermoleophilaceae bacterium]